MNDITSRRHDVETRRLNWTFTIICGVALLFIGGVTGAFLVDYYWHIHAAFPITATAPARPVAVIQKPSPARVEPAVIVQAAPEEVRTDEPVIQTPAVPETEIRRPLVRAKTFSFMPGQTMSIPNRTFKKIEVRSEYPLRIYTGTCHSDYTVEFFCESGPNDIFISDVRRMPVFMTPRANSITLTVTEF